ncbi:MAG: type I-F CRISPR-associated endonuclease Cas1 [Burkholderiales bacterium]|jgi:CRISPR-associated protein Cas1|nr:type I-F CRISPR-associated endonuclease Cas1 [Burkholderiales bacterium]
MSFSYKSGNVISILHSKRAGIYYLEHSRVMMRDDRVEYATEKNNDGSYYWNIPTGNCICILLGSGTSITQAAARRLSEDGVMLAFTGGGGTPLFLASQSEYRPTEYCQNWFANWSSEERRLLMCQRLAMSRCDFIESSWKNLGRLKDREISPSRPITLFRQAIEHATSTATIMEAEARCAKSFYALLSQAFGLSGFTRQQGKKDSQDLANSYLDHGNYLAYGLAAAVLWVLGIPHSLPVSHGMTRRGALVFDVADLVKDGIIMPLAFACAAEGIDDQRFRAECIRELRRLKSMDRMFSMIKETAMLNAGDNIDLDNRFAT